MYDSKSYEILREDYLNSRGGQQDESKVNC